MHIPLHRAARRLTFFFIVIASSLISAQQVDPSLYNGLRWRMIGPFRGGRTVAVSGVQGQPNLYFFGSVGGGVWKTTNAGETWDPIFDSQPIGSVGAIAVAQSNPDIIYVGTGEPDFRSDLSYGNGVYRTTDGGKTWSNIGLRASQHIARIVIDPRDPNTVLVAAVGSAYGPGPERGVFRTTDGGKNWQKVLYRDPETGAIDLALDPENSKVVYASLVYDRRPPWSTYAPTTDHGAVYKSIDGGVTWKQLGGLPQAGLGRIGLAVARGTQGKRLYAMVDAKEDKDRGVYRSDDAGQSWTRVGTDPRVSSRGWYFGEIYVDPKNPNIIYAPNVSIYRSNDGGKNWEAIKGAPGGDDYHAMWIDPTNSQHMIFGSDQGAGVSLDGAKSWSSWYNQPTAQFYHVITDNQYPYHVYGAQQDSGSIDTASRSNDGSITFRDWHPSAAGESGYIAPDPKDANIIYGGSTFGELFRYDKRTGELQVIAPEAVRTFGADPATAEFRFSWTSPLVFSPQDSHTLYYGSQNVLRSQDQGSSWQKISPDLTGAHPTAARDGDLTAANAKERGHGVVYTIAPSALAAGQIWAGSDTGLIHLTRDDGKSWNDVTPQGLAPWSKISLIEAGHFDAGTAYAAIDRHRMDDISPYVYRTHDSGKSWTRINTGIPEGAFVRAVREDPVRKGLLYAGTELGVFFSIDDGDHWQPLQLNLPVSPVHDLVIKDNDLVIATHGRSFWVLDDIAPLRQLTPEVSGKTATLFRPSIAVRIRPNTNHDTPLPPEVPAGENPPPGAVIYYRLSAPAQGEVKIEIARAKDRVAVRTYSSNDKSFEPPAPPSFPSYWFRPEGPLSTKAGMHRLIWNLRMDPVRPKSGLARNVDYSMSTAYGANVPVQPQGPMVLPGDYLVVLKVNGQQVSAQPLKLVMDPRVQLPAGTLEKKFDLEQDLYQAIILGDQQLAAIQRFYSNDKHTPEDQKIETALQEIEPAGGGRGGRRPPAGKTTLSSIVTAMAQIAIALDGTDAAPTAVQTAASDKAFASFKSMIDKLDALKLTEIR